MELVKNKYGISLSKRQQLIIILRALWILLWNDNIGVCYCIRTALVNSFKNYYYSSPVITYFNQDNLAIYNKSVKEKYKSYYYNKYCYWWDIKDKKSRVKYLLWLFKVTRKNL